MPTKEAEPRKYCYNFFMKYILVGVGALLLGIFVAGNADVFRETFFPQQTLVAQISLTDKKESQENLPIPKNFSNIKFCSFNRPLSSIGPIRLIIINEIAWMGDGESFDNEWIEIKNINPPTSLSPRDSINIGGWQILDKDEQIKITFPDDKEIQSGELLVLRRGRDYTGNLKNSEEGLRLFDEKCNLIDEVFANPYWPAGDNKNKFTMERAQDLSWYTSSVVGGTPGKENSPKPSQTSTIVQTALTVASTKKPPILISEIMAGIEGNAKYEFIELYNPGPKPVDLTGFTLKKKTSTGNESVLVVAKHFEGKIMPPGGYFLLVNSEGWLGSPQPDVLWPSSNTLAYTNNGISLYDGTGELIDLVNWEEIPKGSSLERVSWDGNLFKIQPFPSPSGLK